MAMPAIAPVEIVAGDFEVEELAGLLADVEEPDEAVKTG